MCARVLNTSQSSPKVQNLLNDCTHDYSGGGSWYFKISSRRMRNKEVQVIPWVVTDSNFVRCPSQKLDPGRTVFVGALHGMLTAEALSNIFNDLFGGVIYAGKACAAFRLCLLSSNHSPLITSPAWPNG